MKLSTKGKYGLKAIFELSLHIDEGPVPLNIIANSRLRAEMTDICKAHSWSLFMPELSLCGDNAAMVGAQGYYEFKAGNIAPLTLNARASMPIDEIDKFLSKKV